MAAENKAFRKMLEEAIGADNASLAFSAFDSPASVSVRLNPYKVSDDNVLEIKELFERAVPWSEHGRILKERPVFTLDPMFHGGAYYVQDSSSMYVGHVFRNVLSGPDFPQGRQVRVLDLCAAPGGKTTDLSASLRKMCGDSYLIVANEVMKNRLQILSENVSLWGDPNIMTLSADPAAFACLPGFFDIILTDVPCSGEGMFRKDEQAREQWSEDNVKLCAARQRRIIADVWPALAPGGILIYSTCTFNRYENDLNVRWIAEELGAEILSGCFCDEAAGVLRTESGVSLVPGLVSGEGQYCAVLRKSDDARGQQELLRSGSRNGQRIAVAERTGKIAVAERERVRAYFAEDVEVMTKGEVWKAVPKAIATAVRTVEGVLRVQTSGCAAGVFKGKDFVPEVDLALSWGLNKNAFPQWELGREEALAFLRKDNIVLPAEAPLGLILVKYRGLRLGFVKNLGRRCNNLHPQSRRIRMR